MADTITIPQHDRRPAISVELYDGDGNPVQLDVTDTAVFLMRPVTNQSSVLRASATITSYGSVSAPAEVEYEPTATGAPWGDGHVTGTVGAYDQEIEILDTAGLPMTFPTDAANTIVIRDDIDYP